MKKEFKRKLKRNIQQDGIKCICLGFLKDYKNKMKKIKLKNHKINKLFCLKKWNLISEINDNKYY